MFYYFSKILECKESIEEFELEIRGKTLKSVTRMITKTKVTVTSN